MSIAGIALVHSSRRAFYRLGALVESDRQAHVGKPHAHSANVQRFRASAFRFGDRSAACAQAGAHALATIATVASHMQRRTMCVASSNLQGRDTLVTLAERCAYAPRHEWHV